MRMVKREFKRNRRRLIQFNPFWEQWKFWTSKILRGHLARNEIARLKDSYVEVSGCENYLADFDYYYDPALWLRLRLLASWFAHLLSRYENQPNFEYISDAKYSICQILFYDMGTRPILNTFLMQNIQFVKFSFTIWELTQFWIHYWCKIFILL